jgi:dethiobiotin synthetase/adenosylmethionine--8-amino-7-oxononanoate aminotransferase
VQVKILDYLSDCASSGPGTVLVETAGGVHSPTPSGSSQVDLYRPLRLPICLVADHKLGGISASISAFESLHLRGYDLDTILQFEDETYQNHDYLREYFLRKGVLSLSLPPPPSKAPTETEDREIMSEYYEAMSKSDLVTETVHKLVEKHKSRIIDLEEMSTKANNTIWYPFTQHRDVSSKTILAIDSASGDFFQTHISAPKSKSETEIENILAPTFDGSASWWTQGLGHGNPELSLAASYAAGRYGHVMFAGTVHAPALELATTLLSNLNNDRLTKCFFSDNGSTGMEVATKMAFTATSNRYGYDDEQKANIGVLGLKGSYHGDTIGAMDCSEPSTFNEKVHWYKGRGHWLDFPKVKCKEGRWIVEVPDGEVLGFESLTDIFDLERRRDSEAARKYRELIGSEIERLVKREGMTFGALVMEVRRIESLEMCADHFDFSLSFWGLVACCLRKVSGSLPSNPL